MVWGAISSDGWRKIVRLEETLKAKTYVEVLEENLLEYPEIDSTLF